MATEGIFTYEIGTNYARLLECHSTTATSITVPDHLGNKPVRYIGKPKDGDSGYRILSYAPNVQTITLPDTVTTIETHAFERAPSLTSITIPDSVTYMGKMAFHYCTQLKNVTIGTGLEQIGDNVFSYCTALTSIYIPDNVYDILDNAFRECTSLTSISLPDNLDKLGRYIFHDTGYYKNENNWTILDNKYKCLIVNGRNKDRYLLDLKMYKNVSRSEGYKCFEGVRNIASCVLSLSNNKDNYGGNLYLPKSIKRIEDYAFNDGIGTKTPAQFEKVFYEGNKLQCMTYMNIKSMYNASVLDVPWNYEGWPSIYQDQPEAQFVKNGKLKTIIGAYGMVKMEDGTVAKKFISDMKQI